MIQQKVEIVYNDTFLDIPFIGYSSYKKTEIEKSITSCGICCVAMVLASDEETDINVDTLLETAYADGGFGPNGWIHDYLIHVLQETGHPASRQEYGSLTRGITEISAKLLSGSAVIVSTKKIHMEQTSFHMVLLTGIRVDGSGEIVGFYYHDPAVAASHAGTYVYCSRESFVQSWRGRCIYTA